MFPWVGFVFAGAFLGSLLGTPRSEEADRSFHARLSLAGVAIGLTGLVGMHLPSLFAASSFWTTSLSFFLMRNAAMVVGVTLAWSWMRRPTANRWSPTVVFGRTSLFVYWVHVELAYGGFSYPLHNALSLPWSLFAVLMLTLFMLGCAVLWQRRANTPLIAVHLRAA